MQLANSQAPISAGNLSFVTSSINPPLTSTSQNLGGCYNPFNGSRATNTTGYTIFPGRSGESAVTVPCSSFVAVELAAWTSASLASITSLSSARQAISVFCENQSGPKSLRTGSLEMQAYSGEKITLGSSIYTATGGEFISMACNKYLSLEASLQASSFSAMRSFGRSPECKTYSRQLFEDTYNGSTYIVPPYVHNFRGTHDWYCCGQCVLYAPSVSVLFWSTASITTNCPNITAPITLASSVIQARTVDLGAGASFTVLDGSTLCVFYVYAVSLCADTS